MTRTKAIVALILALVYLPATGHCLLERAGLTEANEECCSQSESTDSSPSSACSFGCCPIEYAVYFSPAHGPGVLTSVIAEMPDCVFVALTCPVSEPQFVAPDKSPPVPPNAWQFAFRTALPIRAPSLVS